MRKIKLFLITWGIACLATVITGWLTYPSISSAKLSQSEAIENLELNYNSASKEQASAFEFNKNWALTHSQAIESSAKLRQLYLSIIGILTSVFCFIGAYYLPACNKSLNQDATKVAPIS